MFIEAELLVPLPLGVAKEALDRAVADGGLVAESAPCGRRRTGLPHARGATRQPRPG